VGLFSSCATKSALKKILNKGLIRVNGEKATTATFIHGGEEIELIKEEISEPENQLEYELHVLYEDEHLAAIYKPAGIAVSGNKFKTVANALEQNLSKSNLPDICHPQPAHRLDYPTTGVLLAGKTSSGIRALNLMFEEKEIEKSYLAVAIGEIKKLKGDFDEAIDDKEAFTSYEVLDSVISERFGFLNLVLLQPATGRRHQLRKHLSSRGNAILGDADYSLEGLLLKGKGLYLHAYSVEFTHPFTKENLTIQAPVPKKFLKLFPTILTTAFTKLDQTQ
jgi:23S rRNA pseudouridine1911/1915/1917 synthase|tara:strand:- start:1301 stop:2137 length:837 start_codon:yes stop_codon:yes gene_type:complete